MTGISFRRLPEKVSKISNETSKTITDEFIDICNSNIYNL